MSVNQTNILYMCLSNQALATNKFKNAIYSSVERYSTETIVVIYLENALAWEAYFLSYTIPLEHIQYQHPDGWYYYITCSVKLHSW